MKKMITVILLLLVSSAAVYAGPRTYKARTSGIVFRGSYWGSQDEDAGVQVTNQGLDNSVSVNGYGGWIEFYSRVNDQLFLTWALGSSADTDLSEEFLFQNKVRSKSVSPLVMGVSYQLLPLQRQSAMQPYVSAGAGPYWEHQTKVENKFWDYNKTQVKSKMQIGMNIGCGTFFRVSDTFTLNFDMKYHLVDFDVDNDFSGFEVGFGFGFFWGQY